MAKKKIEPAELTDILQRVKWESFFRNPEKMKALKKAMREPFDEKKIKDILGDILVDRAAYVDDEALIWNKFIQLRVDLSLPKSVILAEVDKPVSYTHLRAHET